MKPCLDCGELSQRSRCPECETTHRRSTRNEYQRRARADGRLARSTTAQGYDSRWKRLSALARKKQPFCVDCGATDDLQADHTPEAWERKRRGKAIRLQDIDVVCRSCNIKRGAARGDNVRR